MSKDLADVVTAYWERVANEDEEQNTKGNSDALEQVRETIIALHELDENHENWTSDG